MFDALVVKGVSWTDFLNRCQQQGSSWLLVCGNMMFAAKNLTIACCCLHVTGYGSDDGNRILMHANCRHDVIMHEIGQ
jgi:hypothetical protein